VLKSPRRIVTVALLLTLLVVLSSRADVRAEQAVQVSAITAAESWLYGTDGDSIFQISPDTGEVLKVGDGQNRMIGDITVTPDGRVFGAGRALMLLNRGNGLAELVANINGVSGLTTEAFASDSAGRLLGSAFYRLFELQPATAVARILTSLDINPNDIAFGPDGNLYATIGPAVGGNTDRLIRINPVNGQAGLIGNIGFRSVDGIAFSPDGRLFGSASAATLIMINTATGAGSAIAVFSNFRSMVGLGSKPPAAPQPPVLAPPQTNGLTLTLSWSAVPGATYVLEAGSGPGLSNLFDGAVGGGTSLTAPAPAGTYYLRVRAANALGVSGPSNEVVATLGAAGPGTCAPPSGLTTSVSGNLLTVQWAGAPGATSYLLEVGTAPGLANALSANVGGSTTQQFNLSGVPPAAYYMRVRTIGSCGTSAPSNEAIVDVR
jgi:hypothetical protein